MVLDRYFKNELKACISAILTRCLHDLRDENEEVWLSKEEFLKQFGMFTEDWIKRNGETLPRTQAVVTDKSGEQHGTRWAYPRNQIQAMIRDGRIKQLSIKSDGGTA